MKFQGCNSIKHVNYTQISKLMDTNQDYCNYELALALKKAGFDWECDHYYTKEDAPDGQVWFLPCSPQDSNNHFIKHYTSAPTLWQAQKWLREVKGIDVLVWNCACGYGWEVSKAYAESRGTTLMDYDDNGEDKDSGMWLTYENALSAGIEAALQILDNENK